ncbi:MAG TPA: ABC transporter permease [Verrucomicrobiota bacterium]|nr:ABC transporter permease [Verrucomicrobiota bacterium]
MNDLRIAFRMLVKSPGFTLAAVVTLALAIGLNTTIFSLVNPVLFRPLPVRDPDRLVFLYEMNSVLKESRLPIAYPDYLDWRAHNRVFDDVGVFHGDSWTVTGRGDPERIRGARISATLFSVLGVAPRLGRDFRKEEDRPGAEPVVLLAYDYWQRRFGGDTNVVGQILSLNAVSHTIVGVMPPGFRFPEAAAVWTPVVIEAPEEKRGLHDRIEGIARLKPGVTFEQAKADLLRISRDLEAQYPASNTGRSAVVRLLREEAVEDFALTSWVLLGAVAFVLAVACANVANMSLSRALDRQREWAIRLSLGSSRWRLIRLLLTESLLLAATGAVLGLLLAQWGLALAQTLVPADAPFWLDFSVDYRVLLFTAGVVVGSCLLFGLAPAWHASRINPVENLRSGSPAAGDQPRQRRLRGILVASEVALALLLLGGTLVMIQSLWNLQRADAGFNPRGVLTFSVTLWQGEFREPARRIAFFEDLQQRLAALPGVKTAAAIYNLPLRGDWWSQAFYLENEPEELSTQRPAGTMRIVTPGYFRAMEIPVLLGRDFNPTDQRTSQPVVIIDESFARRYFPDENPLGRRVKVSNRPDVWWEIVGVARDANHYGLLSERTQSGFYFPYIQQPSFAMTIVLKAEKSGTPGLLTAAQNEVRRLNRDVLVESPRLMQDVMARAYWQISLLGKLLAGFAALALVLAAVGIGAVASYTVSQRTHEIGVRLALGATKREVVRLVLKDGFRLALAGTGIGLLATWGLLRAFQSELYGVSAANPGQYLLLALVLGIVVLTACYLPARRAAKVDPLVALRYE